MYLLLAACYFTFKKDTSKPEEHTIKQFLNKSSPDITIISYVHLLVSHYLNLLY